MTAEADFNDDGVIDFEEFVGLVMRMLLFFYLFLYKLQAFYNEKSNIIYIDTNTKCSLRFQL